MIKAMKDVTGNIYDYIFGYICLVVPRNFDIDGLDHFEDKRVDFQQKEDKTITLTIEVQNNRWETLLIFEIDNPIYDEVKNFIEQTH